MTENNRTAPPDLSVALAVGVVLAMVYLATFGGQFRSIDEFAMFAPAESIAQGRGFETPQLAFAPLHNRVGVLEPGQPLLAAPFYMLGRALPTAHNIAAAMLVNVFVSAATGAVLYLLLRELAFSQTIAAVSAVAWGVGTTAWPYARSFFREPLLGLVLASAATLCIAWQRTRQRRYAIGCLIVLGVGLAVKMSSVAPVPIFLLALLWVQQRRQARPDWRPILAMGILALAALYVANLTYTARYGGRPIPVARYTIEYPLREALLRAYGAFLSPVKGLLFYSPILVATAIGWPRIVRERRLMAVIIVGVVLTFLYAYGNQTAWHGGSVVWGPRYHVPLLPLLMVPYAAALANPRRVARLWVGLWSGIGIALQTAVGTTSWSDAVWQLVPAFSREALVGLEGTPWYSWALVPRSPALLQFTQWHPRKLDIIWIRTLFDGSLVHDSLLAIVLLGLTAIACAALTLLLKRARTAALQRGVTVGCVLLLAVATFVLLVRSGRNTNDYWGLTRHDAQALADAVYVPDAPYAVVLVSNDFFVNYWLGHLKGRFVTQWYSPHDAQGLDSAVETSPDVHRLWAIIDHNHMPHDAEPYLARHSLARQAYEIGGQWVDGYEILEYVLPSISTRVARDARWENGLQVTGIALDRHELLAGDYLLINLELTTPVELAEEYVLFVHLIPKQGEVLTGRDGPPHYGGTPTDTWEPGETVLERRAVRVPETAAPGTYALAVGWVDLSGELLRPLNYDEEICDSRIVLGEVTVLPPREHTPALPERP